MRTIRYLVPALSLLCLVGCAGPLAVQQFASDPNPVGIGQIALVSVTFGGPHARVKTVFATVREAPDISFELVNDGTNGDVKAGDNIWSVQIPVPMDAQAGIYNLDFTILDLDGNLIGMKDSGPPSSGVTGSIAVAVQ